LAVTKGNCYLCGKEIGKTAMKNHLLKNHADSSGEQKSYLLKAEGRYNKNYWIYFDVPVSTNLETVDKFLRRIWLECCGHMSAFSFGDHNDIRVSTKLYNFEEGTQLLHEYDFGSTTETIVTFVAKTTRPSQKNPVRLLARNVPPEFLCCECGKPAEYIDMEAVYEVENPFYCEECADEEGEFLMPITNSPRMGVCGYTGELDCFSFIKPELLE
jgi:hypothetical protein